MLEAVILAWGGKLEKAVGLAFSFFSFQVTLARGKNFNKGRHTFILNAMTVTKDEVCLQELAQGVPQHRVLAVLLEDQSSLPSMQVR